MSNISPSGAISLADFITGNLEPILQDWEDFAKSLVPLAGLDRATLRDHAEAMLVAIVSNMRAYQSEAERSEKGKGKGDSDALTEAAESHALARLTDNFSLNQLMAEFRAIRASVLRQWARVLPHAEAGVEEVMRFNEAVDQAITASIARYSNKLDESRAVILGVLAHDLRNPLNAISLGMQYILRADAADAPTMKAAVRAQLSVQRMDGLVRDLLDFTSVRLGTGLPVRPEVVDLAVLCLRTMDEVEAAHPERKILFTTSGDLKGEWDAGRLSQMLVNLVTNALNHGSADGEVRVTLRGEEQDFVSLEVHNVGPVIPESVRTGMSSRSTGLCRTGAASRPVPLVLDSGSTSRTKSRSPIRARWRWFRRKRLGRRSQHVCRVTLRCRPKCSAEGRHELPRQTCQRRELPIEAELPNSPTGCTTIARSSSREAR